MAVEVNGVRNELERRLHLAQTGELPPEQFMRELIGAQVFLPVQDEKHDIAGFVASSRAKPLVLEGEGGSPALVVFTSPDRGKDFLAGYPDYRGGLLTELKWVLQRMGQGCALVLNPGCELGIDIDPQTVQAMVALALSENSEG